MNKRTIFMSIVILTLAACSLGPVVTPTSLPTTLPPTVFPTLPPATDTPPVVIPTETALQPTATLAIASTATLAIAPTTANTSTSLPPVTVSYNPYAVVLVLPDDVLNIRASAGAENAIVGTLQPTASGVNRTGPVSSAGGGRWVEIRNPSGASGGTGWVNSNFLTEYVTSATFCAEYFL